MSDQTHAAVLTDSVTSQLLCPAVLTLDVHAIIEEAIDTAVLTITSPSTFLPHLPPTDVVGMCCSPVVP